MDWIRDVLTDELFGPVFSIFQLMIGPIVGAILALTGYLFWRKKSRRNLYRKVYYPRNPTDFYKYFSTVIEDAINTIRHSGDGFTLSNPASLRNANTLDEAFCNALAKGVEVRRFQIIASAPISWYSRLAAIKKKWPDKFRIFVNRNHDGIGSFCVIDPGTRNTVFEQQTVSGLIVGRGTEPVNYSFLFGNQTQSDRAAALFDQAALGDGSQELNEEDIWKLQESEWYRRINKAREDASFVLVDPEIIEAIRGGNTDNSSYPSERFRSSQYTDLNFTPNWHT